MSIYPDVVPIAMWLTAYNAFTTGLMVFLKKRCEGGAQYFAVNVAIAIWGGSIAFMLDNRSSYEWALITGRIANAGALWIPPLWLDFVLSYTKQKSKYKKLLLVAYMVSAAVSPFAFSNYFVKALKPIVGFKYIPEAGFLYLVFTVLFAFCVIFSFWIFWIITRDVEREFQRDYRWVFGASLYGFFMGSLSFLPVYCIELPQYNLLIMPTWQMLLTYAMIHHQAFDVQQIADAFQREKLAAIGTMAASLNHELRNPLYIAKGKIESHLDGVERGLSPKEEKSYSVMTVALQQLTRAMDIIQRFSDFSKPLNAKRDREKILLKNAVQDVLGLVSNEFEMHKIALKEEIPGDAWLHVNRRQMEEVFFNLILNACHAMGEKGGQLEIKAVQSNPKIMIEIADTGPGISEENQRRIFEPFFSTKGEKGSGLGLYITKQLIEKNGGKISVKSKIGRGTHFILEFKQ